MTLKNKTTKRVKVWAVLGHPDKLPMSFGSLAKNYKGALSIFERRTDAVAMATLGGKERDYKVKYVWEVRKCEVIIPNK